MFGMDLQFKNFSIENFEQFSGGSKETISSYLLLLNDSINNADSVYVFRTHNHLMSDNSTVLWCKENLISEYDKINIEFSKFNRINEIKSTDNSKIVKVDLNINNNRNEFKKNLRISIRDFKNELASELTSFEMLIDDPLYDQYDYLFEKDGKIISWTDIHELLIFIMK